MLNVPTELLRVAREELVNSEDGAIPLAKTNDPHRNGKYLSHLSALGPALRRMGMLAALANYRDAGGSDEATQPVYEYLGRLLYNENAGLLRSDERQALEEAKELIPYILTLPPHERRHLRPPLERAILASKLALRTFPLPTRN